MNNNTKNALKIVAALGSAVLGAFIGKKHSDINEVNRRKKSDDEESHMANKINKSRGK